jgi:hypothetical protein
MKKEIWEELASSRQGRAYYETEVLLSILNTPPTLTEEASDFEVHVLTCHRNVLTSLWSIKSFILYSRKTPRLVIHDDGSLTVDDLSLFEQQFPRATVLSNEVIDNDIKFRDWLKQFPTLYFWRFVVEHVFAKKVIDFMYFSNAEYVIAFDSDVLFMKYPADVLGSVSRGEFIAMQDYGDLPPINTGNRECYRFARAPKAQCRYSWAHKGTL